MSEKLLNIQEVSHYLGISEVDLRILVDRGEIPAYRLGGSILRFRQDQIEEIKRHGVPKIVSPEEALTQPVEIWSEKWKDFLYFNDFYIITGIIIVALLIAIFFL